MALPNTGPISAAMINVELNKSPSASFSLNAPDVRALAQKPTGQVNFSDFYGKSSELFEVVTMVAGYIPAGSMTVKSTGYWPDQIGFGRDMGMNPVGSVTPATFRGVAIRSLQELHGISGDSATGTYRVDAIRFEMVNASITSTFLKKIRIFLGATLVLDLPGSAASFVNTSAAYGEASWTWTIPASWYLVKGNTYTVRIFYE